MIVKYYRLFLLFPFFTPCISFVHLVERTIASFEEKPIYAKSCKNCKFFIENENIEFSRCSKFMKSKNRQRPVIGEDYKPPLVQHIKVNYEHFREDDTYSALLLFYLAKTCRTNESMCGLDARYYERKYTDLY